MAGLTETELPDGASELHYLDSDVLYDQFVEGMARCADQRLLEAVDVSAIEAVAAAAASTEAAANGDSAPAPVDGDAGGAGGEAPAAVTSAEGGDAVAPDVAPAEKRALPMPLDRKLQQFFAMFTKTT